MKFDITVLLDRSGSMQSRKDDHIGGLRSFIQDQKYKGETVFSLIQFDSENPFELLIDAHNIESVDIDSVDLLPRGGTPLLDAVGKTIAHIDSRIKNQEVQVVLFIITDGFENDSREWDKIKVKAAIDEKKTWQIMYLAANVDAFSDAGSIGTGLSKTMNYANTPKGVENVWLASNNKMCSMRSVYDSGGDLQGALSAGDYTQEDRVLCSDGDAKLAITSDIVDVNWKVKKEWNPM